MAYRIDPTEPTAAEVRRVIDEELGQAVEELRTSGGPDAGQIHSVRKHLKKTRSLLRLARGDLGAAVSRHANAELRDVGKLLAAQRDADSLVEALDRLLADDGFDQAPDGAATAAALRSLRQVLVERAEEVRRSGAASRSLVLGCALRLTETRVWLDRVPPRASGWAALRPGFQRQYRRGRRRLLDLPAHPTTHELHEWRKRVKDLWYHQRLLDGLWPEAQRPILEAADQLSDLLGDDHDLGVLLGHLEPGGQLDGVLDDRDLDLVVRRAELVRERLQAEARPLGHLLYADSPHAWAARHGSWWASANRSEEAGEVDNPSTEAALA